MKALGSRCGTPILLTRVEHERDWIRPAQQSFVEAAEGSGTRVDVIDVIDVPGASHRFETVDDTDDTRSAIRQGVGWAVAQLQ